MTAQDVPTQLGERKAQKRVFRHFWYAVTSSMFDHEIVGAHIPPPRAAEPERHAWPPFMVWQWLIKETARQDRERVIKGKVIPLRRGQLAVSERYLAREANWGRKSVRVFLERLEKFGMITAGVSARPQPELDRSSSKKGPSITIITVCNYDTYQKAPEAKGPRRAQQGPSRGPAGAQDSTVVTDDTSQTDHHLSDLKLNDDDRAKPRRISPSLVQTLTNHTGPERSAELVSEYLGSGYARNARVLDRAFIGWLRKTYGVVISGAGTAAPNMADILSMCGTDRNGRPITTLPTTMPPRRVRA